MPALMTLFSKTAAPAMVVLCALAIAACSKPQDNQAKNGSGQKKRAIPVLLDTTRQKQFPVQLQATGTVEPFASVAIKAQVSGIVEEIHFQEGQEVTAGEVLFTLDRRPFTAALNQAQAALARDRAQLDNARGELQRYRAAEKKGYVSSEQAEQAATKAATFAATVKADEAAVEHARLQLEFCTITAPVSGRTGEVASAVGNLIKANDDSPLVTINRIRPIKVNFTVPGKHLPEIVRYQQAGSLRVAVVAGGTDLPGRFSFFDNRIDPASGTLRLKAEFANDDGMLWPGQTVNVRLLLTTRPEATVVPTRAIQLAQEGPRVFVVDEGDIARERAIVSGPLFGEETVVESGLTPGERVVVDGQLQVTDGAKVEERSTGNQKGKGEARQERGKP